MSQEIQVTAENEQGKCDRATARDYGAYEMLSLFARMIVQQSAITQHLFLVCYHTSGDEFWTVELCDSCFMSISTIVCLHDQIRC